MAFNRPKPIITILTVYLICVTVRLFDCLVLRWDQRFIGENFVHKIIGILILLAAIKMIHFPWKYVGFEFQKFAKFLAFGIELALISFTFAVGVEILVLKLRGLSPEIQLYTNLSDKSLWNTILVTSFVFEIFNVVMEEGIFRGFFLSLAKQKYNSFFANLFVAFLFGLWHLVMPFRDYLDGKTSLLTMLMLGAGYIVLSGMVSLKWGMLREMTGALTVGLADHFLNNFILDILHVTTKNGADELKIIRAVIVLAVSISITLVFYQKQKRKIVSAKVS